MLRDIARNEEIVSRIRERKELDRKRRRQRAHRQERKLAGRNVRELLDGFLGKPIAVDFQVGPGRRWESSPDEPPAKPKRQSVSGLTGSSFHRTTRWDCFQ